MNFGLSTQAIALLQKVLQAHPEVERAKIFGSRAIGNFRPNSDIDLALWGVIDEGLLAKLYAELDELPLPYQFDVTSYITITHPALREHIDKFGKDIYVKK